MTDTPSPTATETPSETPTETPTATFTETATETATLAETATETPALTETATATLAETPTASGSETATETPTETPTTELTTTATLTETATGTMTLEPSPTPPYGDFQPPISALQSSTGVVRVVPADNAGEFVNAVNAANNGDIIWLRGGNYQLAATLVINKNIIIDGFNPIIEAAGPNIQLFRIEGVVEFHHLTIQGGGGVNPTNPSYGGAIANLGELTIFDSRLQNNHAVNGGGAIFNQNVLNVYRTAFVFNHAGGGGAIQNDFGGRMEIACSTFIDNHAGYGGAILNGDVDNQGSVINTHNSSFGINVIGTPPNDSDNDIHNLAYAVSQSMVINATGNWWHDEQDPTAPDGSSRDPNVSPEGGVNATGALEYNPTKVNASGFYDNPACIPESARDVADEAILFHMNAREFGLPLPFDVFPYRDTTLIGLRVQGFGPTTFAYEDWNNNEDDPGNASYYGIFNVHPGVDYGGVFTCSDTASWCEEEVIAVCDGVIVDGRIQNPAAPGYGGTAAPGFGVSLRCFADAYPNDNVHDTDGDGIANLSNIVLVYNHLLDTLGVVVDVGQVVNKGDVLGRTGYGTPDHLHWEMYFARDYLSSSGDTVLLNPVVMFSASLLQLHDTQHQGIKPYYPVKWQRDRNAEQEDNPRFEYHDETVAIMRGELNQLSLGAVEIALGSRVFWSTQDVDVIGPEWTGGLHPIPLQSADDFMTFVLTLFQSSPFDYPNCTQGEALSCPTDDLVYP